jgi:serine protein kinase
VILLARLEAYRAEERQLARQGTFKDYKDYLEMVLANPAIVRLSHTRLHDMVRSEDVTALPNDERSYGFFADQLYAINRPLQQLVDYFASAARQMEVRKRILLLMGPCGGGSSTIVSMLKRSLEDYTRTDSGTGLPGVD